MTARSKTAKSSANKTVDALADALGAKPSEPTTKDGRTYVLRSVRTLKEVWVEAAARARAEGTAMGTMINKWIEDYANGDYTRPTCSRCGVVLERTTRTQAVGQGTKARMHPFRCSSCDVLYDINLNEHEYKGKERRKPGPKPRPADDPAEAKAVAAYAHARAARPRKRGQSSGGAADDQSAQSRRPAKKTADRKQPAGKTAAKKSAAKKATTKRTTSTRQPRKAKGTNA